MRAKEFVTELFDQPYPVERDKTGTAFYANLDDGSNLRIKFRQVKPKSWEVLFDRGDRSDITGEGDAMRTFATVLDTILKFVKENQPAEIKFWVNKEDEGGYESRKKLYNRLINRYASKLGYNLQSNDHEYAVTYTLKNPDIKISSTDKIEDHKKIVIHQGIKLEFKNTAVDQIAINAETIKGKDLGSVVFRRQGSKLIEDDFKSDLKTGAIIYNYLTKLGFKIHPDPEYRTPQERELWAKNNRADAEIWEQTIINEVPLPQDWDKDVYRGKGTFKDRIRYAVERAKKVGTGSSRVAFIIEYEGRPTVLKIAKNNKGLSQNNVEADILDDSYVESLDITIPLIDYDTENPQPLWIHTELAEKATEKKLCEIMRCSELYALVELAKVITGKYYKFNNYVSASQALDSIKQKTGMSDQDLSILEDYATRIAELVVNFDLAPGDFAVHKNWGIYKGKPVIIDLGLSDTVLQSLYQKK